MARYIDADALKQRLLVGSELDQEPCKGFRSALLAMVDTQEDDDVVPVVRCKDCKFYDFWERRGIHLCVRWSGDPYEAAEPGEDDFCSFAERRDDAET